MNTYQTYMSKIIDSGKLRLEARKRCMPLAQIRTALEAQSLTDSRFISTLREHRAVTGKLGIIAEVKRASPSKGLICPDFDPLRIALNYERSACQCISVLTEEDHFQGHSDDLKKVVSAVAAPVLRKDFIIEAYQIYESALFGAQAILLIASLLSDVELASFYQIAKTLKLDVLFEVHTAEALERVLALNPVAVGINNRNLDTFEVDLNNSLRLMEKMPPSIVAISESGIRTSADMACLSEAGFSGVLIGEQLMRRPELTAEFVNQNGR